MFVVEDKEVAEGKEPNAFWTRVGSAWPHKDGKGLNLVLSAVPVATGRLVLREYTPEDEKDDERKVAKFRKK